MGVILKDAKVSGFRDLLIWQRGITLVEQVYQSTASFPDFEKYGLTSQIRRCSVSIPSNIAEGFGRGFKNEYKQFLYVAIGSASELITQLVISVKLGYLKENQAAKLIDEVEQISKMTMSLIKKLEASNHK